MYQEKPKDQKEPTERKKDPRDIWAKFTNGKNYKSGEKMYDIIRRNEEYYAGEQWRGVEAKGLPTPVLNFLEQLVDVKVSTLMSNELTIHRRPSDLTDDDYLATLAAKAFNLMDKRNWDRLRMEQINEQVLLDGALSGLGATYWYWDNDIRYGNNFRIAGDIKCEVLDSVNLYVSNPNDDCIQNQDWVIISSRKTVPQARKMAKKAGLKQSEIDMIQGDEDTVYEAFEKAQNEQDSEKGSQYVTVLTYFYKKYNEETEKIEVYFCRSIQNVMIQKETPTELQRYPIAIMQWKRRKRFIYGTAEITSIIANQQHINKMEAMRQLHAQLMAIPKVGYNRNMIAGMTNTVGGILPINAQPGDDISKAIHYWQPTAMSIDVDKSIESTLQKTREYKGINDNVIGAAKAENTSAIIAQQRAAGVPLESVKRRFWHYLRDVALLWNEFYTTKYNTPRIVSDIETGEKIMFTGTEFKDVILDTMIDVGASTQWSDALSAETLDRLLDRGHIDIKHYLQRYPKNIIPDQDKLIEDIEIQRQEAIMQQLPQHAGQIPMGGGGLG